MMTLCNLPEPEIQSLLSNFLIPGIINKLLSLSEGRENVGGEEVWDEPRSCLLRQGEKQKLQQGSQGRRVWGQDL